MKDLGVDSCIDLFCDSQSAICFTKDQMFHERTNHIDVKYHYVRDVISQGKLKVCKISTHDNPADMTKPVPVASWFDSLVQETIWRQNFYSLLCSGDDFDMLQEGICLKVEYVIL